MTGILGKKIGMTQVFTEDGRLVPVTVVEAGPCYVIQVKTQQRDGYEAVKVGFTTGTGAAVEARVEPRTPVLRMESISFSPTIDAI